MLEETHFPAMHPKCCRVPGDVRCSAHRRLGASGSGSGSGNGLSSPPAWSSEGDGCETGWLKDMWPQGVGTIVGRVCPENSFDPFPIKYDHWRPDENGIIQYSAAPTPEPHHTATCGSSAAPVISSPQTRAECYAAAVADRSQGAYVKRPGKSETWVPSNTRGASFIWWNPDCPLQATMGDCCRVFGADAQLVPVDGVKTSTCLMPTPTCTCNTVHGPDGSPGYIPNSMELLCSFPDKPWCMTSELVDMYNGGDCAAIDITSNRGDTVRGYTCVVSSKPPPSPPPQGLQPPPPQPSPPPPTPPPNPSCAFESAEARKKYALELAALADEDGSGGLWPGEFRTLLCGRDGTSRDRGEFRNREYRNQAKWAPYTLGRPEQCEIPPDPTGDRTNSEAIALHDVRGDKLMFYEMLDLTPKLDCGGGLVPFGEVSFEAFWYVVGRNFVERRLPPCSGDVDDAALDALGYDRFWGLEPKGGLEPDLSGVTFALEKNGATAADASGDGWLPLWAQALLLIVVVVLAIAACGGCGYWSRRKWGKGGLRFSGFWGYGDDGGGRESSRTSATDSDPPNRKTPPVTPVPTQPTSPGPPERLSGESIVHSLEA
jgi:hypothetical protein